MTLADRVEKIEVSLTPKQAVLLWLKEAHEVTSFRDWIVKNAEVLVDAHPRIVIRNEVANAVRDAPHRRGTLVESSMRASLEAQKQADFLVSLALIVNQQQLVDYARDCPTILYLQEQQLYMLEQVLELSIDFLWWRAWREVLIANFTRLWQQKAAIAQISREYYDDHKVLFADEAAGLDSLIQVMEFLVAGYNIFDVLVPSWRAVVPSWKTIDLSALQRSTKTQVGALVRELVGRAKIEMHNAFGEYEAARRIMRADLRIWSNKQSSARHSPG